ncbi:MAG: restriction endonuclease [Phenylobacterium sp.]|uniref:restriction endonuclease n=1 Tax=Phenylobacterium sp. TaxID=1871053 RepID=UPI0025DADF36|nr:restriction endonuclease [Phenylobacterium sp.]MCG9916665.1 restriction endonuclease [Phenylobacterium sp.]
MLPVLKLFSNGAAKSVADCLPHLRAEFSISDEEANQLIPSGRLTTLQSRAHWARTYLSKAGLLRSPRRNVHEITQLGHEFLATNPDHISNTILSQFDDFAAWRALSITPRSTEAGSPIAPPIDDRQTPEDAIEAATAILNSTLSDDLLSLLLEVTPQRFERIILDLLSAMGYGGGRLDNASMTPTAGDGGIDGIINEDALGLDAVYIQAKRYAPENKVSRPDIQRFIGSLTGEGATKGVFVTTSDFSREARDYIQRVQHRVVLINGRKLTDLMIAYEVGVRARQTYVLRSVDEDYFA